jgi:predicted tellurium resistance membrane protein TerC
MELLADPQVWIAFATLTVLELVLGIDNVIFISILAGKLPEEQQQRARTIGLSLALVMRVILLLSLTWVMGLTAPLFTVFSEEISGRDLILLVGGLFLIAKSTHEIHGSLEGGEGHGEKKIHSSFVSVIIQITLQDIVFSLDSVITAVGMVGDQYRNVEFLGVQFGIWIMIAAVTISIIAMMLFAGPIGAFVQRHPTVKMLALSFLLLIGVTLIAEGLDMHIPKGYIYFAMAFSVLVELLNMKLRKPEPPVHLHNPYGSDPEPDAKLS